MVPKAKDDRKPSWVWPESREEAFRAVGSRIRGALSDPSYVSVNLAQPYTRVVGESIKKQRTKEQVDWLEEARRYFASEVVKIVDFVEEQAKDRETGEKNAASAG